MPSTRTTPHTESPQNSTEMASRDYKGNESVSGIDPKFFAKKHKKGLRKMKANNAKAMSVHAKAIKVLVKPKEVKPKISKGIGPKFS